MQKKCSKCGKPIKEVGRLVKISWLGRRTPLCVKCRQEIRKRPKSRFIVDELFRRLRGESTSEKNSRKK